MARQATFRVLDDALVSSFGPSTATQTSSSVPIDYANGFFSISGLASSAATASVALYYQLSEDNVNWNAATLATDAVGSTFIVAGIDPPVSRWMRVVAIGTADNAPSGTVKAWISFTED